ncbi:Rv1476 family membrane protein [Corynebacterium kalidii]|uniref:Uncharacterized protein n=1 Tax=Corynebacterium kalidii TaxID=2931982 RepID=A0A9X2B3H9_9CORY|nr:DUF6676 family protein [Corynebacterium kalidii]MCJ7859695.1 hypothetical protein [Corynebacterium kalidii]
MDFENIDLQAILDDIAESGFSTSQTGDDLSPDDVAGYRDLADQGVDVVILDGTSAEGTGLRNLAQTVKDSTRPDGSEGAQTVIVRAPHNAQVVSDSMSRFQIESNQGILQGSTAPQDVVDFLAGAETAEPDFTALNVAVLVGVLVTVAVAAAFARLGYRR